MELRHLRYFVAVAEERSFSVAAKRLRIAQPPLSMQIRGLEETLGVKLFDRSLRPIVLTPAGVAFLEDARRILADIEATSIRASRFANGHTGQLKVAFISALANDLLAGIIRDFRKGFPDVDVILSEMPSSKQALALAQRQIDLGFMRRTPGTEAFRYESVCENRLMLAVPSRHPLREVRSLRWKQLADIPLIVIDPQVALGFYDEFLLKCGRTLQSGRIQMAGDIHTALWMVSAGFGVAPTIDAFRSGGCSNIAFIDLPSDAPKMEILMALTPNNVNPIATKFFDFTVKTVKKS